MNETDLIGNIPTWMKYVASAAGGVGAALLFLRQWLSQAKVDRTANEANVETIVRLQAQVVVERDRADALMREREEMARKIGSLEGEVKGLRDQVDALSKQTQQQSKQIADLLQFLKED